MLRGSSSSARARLGHVLILYSMCYIRTYLLTTTYYLSMRVFWRARVCAWELQDFQIMLFNVCYNLFDV